MLVSPLSDTYNLYYVFSVMCKPHILWPSYLSFLCFAVDFVVTLYLQDPNGGYGGGPGQASKCSILWQYNVSLLMYFLVKYY